MANEYFHPISIKFSIVLPANNFSTVRFALGIGRSPFRLAMSETQSKCHIYNAMEEHRRINRQRILKGGKIALKRGGILSCIVRNISLTGASLEVTNPFGIPDNFTLIMDGDKSERPCHIEWRRGMRIGVSFSRDRLLPQRLTGKLIPLEPLNAG